MVKKGGAVMRIKAGMTVKVTDIGAPAKVLSTGKGYAELLFKFSDGEEITSKCPLSIIDAILEREAA